MKCCAPTTRVREGSFVDTVTLSSTISGAARFLYCNNVALESHRYRFSFVPVTETARETGFTTDGLLIQFVQQRAKCVRRKYRYKPQGCLDNGRSSSSSNDYVILTNRKRRKNANKGFSLSPRVKAEKTEEEKIKKQRLKDVKN